MKWLDVPDFKNWLSLDYDNKLYVFCKTCELKPPGKRLRGRLHILTKHAKSKEHLIKMKSTVAASKENLKVPLRQESSQILKLSRAKLKASVLSSWATFSPLKSNGIIQTFAMVDENKKGSLSNMSVGATQCRDMLVNVVETATQKELATWLKNHLFTASVDESTDHGHQKVFAITVRFADFDRGTIRNTFLDLPLVFKQGEDASSKSDRLFECFTESLQKSDIPFSNIYAVSFDNTNSMASDKNGFQGKVHEVDSHVLCIGCPAHKTVLCMKWASTELPPEFLELIRDINSLLNSPHRKHNFKVIQEDLDYIVHNVFCF